MLFFLAGSALVQYVKYLIAPDFQIEQGTRLAEQAPSAKPVAPPDSKLGSSAQGCVCKVSPGAQRGCGEPCRPGGSVCRGTIWDGSCCAQDDLLQESVQVAWEAPAWPGGMRAWQCTVLSAVPRIPFCSFLEKQCRLNHWDTPVLGGLRSLP